MDCLIPPSYWKLPNFSLLLFLGLVVYGYWAVSLISSPSVNDELKLRQAIPFPLFQRWQVVENVSPLETGVHGLVYGLAALVPGFFMP
jgi:hypothetical protein